jgi:TatD DNase family protein
MPSPLPPLDAHAHVLTGIAPSELTVLGAALFAVTRGPAEWQPALARRDPTTVWGVGVHPGVPAALEAFDAERFVGVLPDATLVGEVGLDGRAQTPKDTQGTVFDTILSCTAADPRPVSVHSVAAATPVLDAIERHPQPGIILHWWRGGHTETARAIEYGCWFSLNGAEAANPKVVDQLPPDRVLTETDFPHTRRRDRRAARPGAVGTIEEALATAWGLDARSTRRQIWRNLRALLDATGQLQRMPRGIRRSMLAIGR